MNAPIRRLALVTFVLFALLLGSSTWIQALNANALRKDPRNTRTTLAQLSKERGPIIVDGTAVATSVAVNDEYKFQRRYPQGSLYAHVTGAYMLRIGATGLERAESDVLSGTSDEQFVGRISDLLTGKEPKGGLITTSIVPKLQQVATDALKGQKGAVVAMNPRTGAILAMVSLPSYDPNTLASHDTGKAQDAWKAMNADKNKPLNNRAVAGDLYPPGSTFKLITASAALESGRYDSNSQLPGPASLKLPGTNTLLRNHDNSPCGPNNQVDMTRALTISCNTAFASLGMAVGGDALRKQAESFGFEQPLSIPLTVTPSSMAKTLDRPQTAQSAIGQYEDRVTPLQMCMVASAIANRGTLMTPYLVSKVQADDLSVLSQTNPHVMSRPISTNTANQLTEMMKSVVTSGTGRSAQISGIDVAGKTGTAQTGNSANAHAWFVSFAPAQDPQIAVAVVVENGGNSGGDGGRVAAPIARQVIQAAINR